MEEQQVKYLWKCPECGTEQPIMSAYFSSDGGANERCSSCGKHVLVRHPISPFKRDSAVFAYVKKD